MTASAEARDLCALPRAIIAAETALRDALARSSGPSGPLRATLARIASVAGDTGSPVLTAYLQSRDEIADMIVDEGVVAARQLARSVRHRGLGQAAIASFSADGICGTASEHAEQEGTRQAESGDVISGGHGGAATAGSGSATGSGQAATPGGQGMETSPLSFLRGFNATWHVIPAFGATLAFGGLVYLLTRDRRQHRRYLCHMPVEVEVGPAVNSTLMLDISQGGAKIARVGSLEIGALAKLRLEPTAPPRRARVIWANSGFVGVSFRKALSSNDFQKILSRAHDGAGAASKVQS